MRQAGNLQQVGKGFWLGIDQHLAHKMGSYLRQRKGSGLGINILRLHSQGLGRGKQGHYLRVAHGNIHNVYTGVIL